MGKEIRDAEKHDVPAACRPSAAAGSQFDHGATNASLLDELTTLFATDPSPRDIVEFRPLLAVVERANQLLELNRCSAMNDSSRQELAQFQMAENLLRLVKARIRAGQASERFLRVGLTVHPLVNACDDCAGQADLERQIISTKCGWIDACTGCTAQSLAFCHGTALR